MVNVDGSDGLWKGDDLLARAGPDRLVPPLREGRNLAGENMQRMKQARNAVGVGESPDPSDVDLFGLVEHGDALFSPGCW